MVSGYCWRWRGPHLWRWRDSHIFGGWESHTAQLGHPCACPYAAKKIAGTPGFNLGILHMPICCQIDWYTWAQPGASCTCLCVAKSVIHLGSTWASCTCLYAARSMIHLGSTWATCTCLYDAMQNQLVHLDSTWASCTCLRCKANDTPGLNLNILHMSMCCKSQ